VCDINNTGLGFTDPTSTHAYDCKRPNEIANGPTRLQTAQRELVMVHRKKQADRYDVPRSFAVPTFGTRAARLGSCPTEQPPGRARAFCAPPGPHITQSTWRQRQPANNKCCASGDRANKADANLEIGQERNALNRLAQAHFVGENTIREVAPTASVETDDSRSSAQSRQTTVDPVRCGIQRAGVART